VTMERDDALAKIPILQTKYSDVVSELDSVRNEKTQVTMERDDALAKIPILQIKYSDIASELESVRTEKTQVMMERDDALAKIPILQTKYSDVVSELDSVRAEKAKVMMEIDSIRQEKEQISSLLLTRDTQYANATMELSSLREENERMTDLLKNRNEEILQLQARVNEFECTLLNYEKNCCDIDQLQTKYLSLTSELKDKTDELEVLQQIKFKCESDIKDLKVSLHDKQAEIEELLNLKDEKNPSLRERVNNGEISAAQLCNMSVQELASKELNEQRKKLADEATKRSMIAKNEATTDQFRCSRCNKRECSYSQLQTRSADEPMTVFVCCINCGHRWKM